MDAILVQIAHQRFIVTNVRDVSTARRLAFAKARHLPTDYQALLALDEQAVLDQTSVLIPDDTFDCNEVG